MVGVEEAFQAVLRAPQLPHQRQAIGIVHAVAVGILRGEGDHRVHHFLLVRGLFQAQRLQPVVADEGVARAIGGLARVGDGHQAAAHRGRAERSVKRLQLFLGLVGEVFFRQIGQIHQHIAFQRQGEIGLIRAPHIGHIAGSDGQRQLLRILAVGRQHEIQLDAQPLFIELGPRVVIKAFAGRVFFRGIHAHAHGDYDRFRFFRPGGQRQHAQ